MLPGPHRLGVHARDGGVDVAVLASGAEQVELCLVDEDGHGGRSERRVALPAAEHGVWQGFVPGVAPGQRYGFRVHGPWDPPRGLRHNPAKLLLDPYAAAIEFPTDHYLHPAHRRRLPVVPELFGHTVGPQLDGDATVADLRDSLPHAPLGVVLPDGDRHPPGVLGRPAAPRVSWADTVVYEVHVKGFTAALPGVPEALRGTYAGLGHPAAVEYLAGLGVSTVELLPVHAIADEVALARRGQVNYWGYSTLGFFAPHPGYAAASDPLEVVAEFRAMVDALHAAGLEVLLDVVYNHTCEGGNDGPSLSWRGLDATTYYRMDGAGQLVDTTGCGNSLDFRQPRVVQLVLDSLRHWVGDLGVDGFRFDLAPTLARGRDGYDPDHPLLVAMRSDPLLAQAKLIAEPWDLGSYGWRTGQFPAPFAEWNDHFRDSARDFWLIDAARTAAGESGSGVRDLATRLAGSADIFPPSRGPLASVNFITAHDGFTLADACAYTVKHNEANGEGNRDGTDNNHSWNHGVEGPAEADDAGPFELTVTGARLRSSRNLLATLLLATGVPMLVAGDEFGRSQGGNNNAYCHDNPTTWLDWQHEPWQEELRASVAHLLALRRSHPVLGQSRFFAGRPVHPDGTKDLAWFAADGQEMDGDRWHDPGQRVLQMYLHGTTNSGAPAHENSLLVVVQGNAEAEAITLPGPPWGARYHLTWDSSLALPPGHGAGELVARAGGTKVVVPAMSVQVYQVSET